MNSYSLDKTGAISDPARLIAQESVMTPYWREQQNREASFRAVSGLRKSIQLVLDEYFWKVGRASGVRRRMYRWELQQLEVIHEAYSNFEAAIEDALCDFEARAVQAAFDLQECFGFDDKEHTRALVEEKELSRLLNLRFDFERAVDIRLNPSYDPDNDLPF